MSAVLSPAERKFLELVSRPAAFAAWAREARLAWERDNVVWFHGFENGAAVWRRERPPADPDPENGAGPRYAPRPA